MRHTKAVLQIHNSIRLRTLAVFFDEPEERFSSRMIQAYLGVTSYSKCQSALKFWDKYGFIEKSSSLDLRNPGASNWYKLSNNKNVKDLMRLYRAMEGKRWKRE